MKTTNPVLKVLRTLARLFGTVVLMFVAFMVSSMVSGADASVQLTPEEAQTSGMVVLLVSLINALVLSYLALRSRWHGWKLAGALFLAQFGVETFMSQVETVVFNQALQLTTSQVLMIFFSGLLRALIFAPLAVWILGKTRRDPADEAPNPRLVFSAGEWVKRLTGLAALYVVVYFLFGYFVAWQWDATRQFYSGSTDILPFFTHMVGVLSDDPRLVLIQFGRGLMWVGLVLPVVRMFKGGALETCFAVALTLGVLMAVFVLFPNPYMPALVRQSHFYELLSSMLTFGALTGWVLVKK
jgi:hypothetical protein